MQDKPYIRFETEYSPRPDGKINVWRRSMGKYWWTDWLLIAVRRIVNGK